MTWVWIVYIAATLLISVLVGLHLGRFREAYTEMTGMVAGMTMGMLNGFLLGYAAAAITGSMFWGNLFGVLMGLSMGAYFGRAGSLMGVMDGAMGGVMGGSMGAMLMVMLVWPPYIMWTAALLAAIYLAGMFGLVLLIERSAPGHAALHRLMPIFTRAVVIEAFEAQDQASYTPHSLPILDYYALLGIHPDANDGEITQAYLKQLATADEASVEQLEMALATLAHPSRRAAYDRLLAASEAEATLESPAPEIPTYRAPQVRTTEKARREAPISWVGVVAAIAIVVILAGWWLANQGTRPAASSFANPLNLPADFVQKLEARATVVPVQPDGKQTLDLVVNGDTMSYKPNVIKVQKGVPVHINLSTEGRDPT
ncbi:MAG TPA: hypothetical protein VFG99_12440 [Chloroflexia bacterium]|nr:hypothetical protein [Chloroflexia bacterium]